MDDRKLNELLNKALASLNDEQKEKAKTCKTAKELIDFLTESGAELPDELLDKVAGGFTFYFSSDLGAASPVLPSECSLGGDHDWDTSVPGYRRCRKCGQTETTY